MERFEVSARRRFRRRPYRALVAGLALAVLFVVRLWHAPQVDVRLDGLDEGPHEVVRVVDGDTIIVAPDVSVRLIGVNTPETVKPEHPIEPWGPEASAYTKQFVAGGTVRLSFDRERTDRYGRSLAYVWVGEKLLNEELLRAGLGRFEPQFHYAEPMKRRFRQAQQAAQQEGCGIWWRGD